MSELAGKSVDLEYFVANAFYDWGMVLRCQVFHGMDGNTKLFVAEVNLNELRPRWTLEVVRDVRGRVFEECCNRHA